MYDFSFEGTNPVTPNPCNSFIAKTINVYFLMSDAVKFSITITSW